MHSTEQLAILEEDGLLIIPSNPRRTALRLLGGLMVSAVGALLCALAGRGLESVAQIFLRPGLWLGAVLVVLGCLAVRRALGIRRCGLQLILTDESLVLEHRPEGTWSTLHRLRWDEIIAFAPAHGSLPGAAGHVLYTLRPAAARRIAEQRAALDDPAHRPSWTERATQIESGRGAIPAQIGDGPTQLLETLRAAHRRFG